MAFLQSTYQARRIWEMGRKDLECGSARRASPGRCSKAAEPQRASIRLTFTGGWAPAGGTGHAIHIDIEVVRADLGDSHRFASAGYAEDPTAKR